jgi:hypothetical protein
VNFAGEKIQGKEFKLYEDQRRRFIDYTNTLLEGRYMISINREPENQTDKQRKYLHGIVLTAIAQETSGDTSNAQIEETKREMKRLFLTIPRAETIPKLLMSYKGDDKDEYRSHLWECRDKDFPYEVRSTADLNKREYAKFTEEIVRWAVMFLNLIIARCGDGL